MDTAHPFPFDSALKTRFQEKLDMIQRQITAPGFLENLVTSGRETETSDERMRGRLRVILLSLGSLNVNLSVAVNKAGDKKRALLSRHAQRTKRQIDYSWHA